MTPEMARKVSGRSRNGPQVRVPLKAGFLAGSARISCRLEPALQKNTSMSVLHVPTFLSFFFFFFCNRLLHKMLGKQYENYLAIVIRRWLNPRQTGRVLKDFSFDRKSSIRDQRKRCRTRSMTRDKSLGA